MTDSFGMLRRVVTILMAQALSASNMSVSFYETALRSIRDACLQINANLLPSLEQG